MRKSVEKELRIIQAIAGARKEAGLSKMEVSARLKASPNFMAKVEAGKRVVKAWELIDIADAMKIDPHDLLDRALPRSRRSRGS